MNISIASDHAGFELKNKIINHLKTIPNIKKILDLGPQSSERVDFPDFANLVCEKLDNKVSNFGILICGSGQGMSMRANKYPHIRAALCWTAETAKLSREHNNANVLCIGSRFNGDTTNIEILNVFLSTKFEGGRHTKRVEKINKSTT